MPQEDGVGAMSWLLGSKVLRSFLIFSIFRAIYGAGIVVITYFLATSGDSPFWMSIVFLMSSMAFSRVIFRRIKDRWPHLS